MGSILTDMELVIKYSAYLPQVLDLVKEASAFRSEWEAATTQEAKLALADSVIGKVYGDLSPFGISAATEPALEAAVAAAFGLMPLVEAVTATVNTAKVKALEPKAPTIQPAAVEAAENPDAPGTPNG